MAGLGWLAKLFHGLIMFDHLPAELQQRVKAYLSANNFRAAKDLYENWLQSQKTALSPPLLPEND